MKVIGKNLARTLNASVHKCKGTGICHFGEHLGYHLWDKTNIKTRVRVHIYEIWKKSGDKSTIAVLIIVHLTKSSY